MVKIPVQEHEDQRGVGAYMYGMELLLHNILSHSVHQCNVSCVMSMMFGYAGFFIKGKVEPKQVSINARYA